MYAAYDTENVVWGFGESGPAAILDGIDRMSRTCSDVDIILTAGRLEAVRDLHNLTCRKVATGRIEMITAEFIERRNLVRITLPSGEEVSVQFKTDSQYGDRLEIVCEKSIRLLPIIGSNGIAISL
jgi:hypothetical protein